MIQKGEAMAATSVNRGGHGHGHNHRHQDAPYFYYAGSYAVMTSGQVSPSDTLDSGTGSDLDGGGRHTPPQPTKTTVNKNGVSVTFIGGPDDHHHRPSSQCSGLELFSDGDSDNGNLSCDSLNHSSSGSGKSSPVASPVTTVSDDSRFLPQPLLRDIRDRGITKLTIPGGYVSNGSISTTTTNVAKVDEKSYEDRLQESKRRQEPAANVVLETYKFHINEHDDHCETGSEQRREAVVEDDAFAGYRDVLGTLETGNGGTATIRSAKGTIRGVKNRVRAGIQTFLQINSSPGGKNYKEKELGKVVVYTTTMGVLRDTYAACTQVKRILRTLLVKFEERDVFMSVEYQQEVKERTRMDRVCVPQVFVDGQHIGDSEAIERLNETGELRRIMKPFKSMEACSTCQVCGGYRLLPCQICKGSKKSVHRNHFTAEFVALKCMNCDEVGLVKCTSCS